MVSSAGPGAGVRIVEVLAKIRKGFPEEYFKTAGLRTARWRGKTEITSDTAPRSPAPSIPQPSRPSSPESQDESSP